MRRAALAAASLDFLCSRICLSEYQKSGTMPIAPDLIQRNFTAVKAYQIWVGDITYLWTAEGWQYLAVFIDLYSRMVVGWAMGTRLQSSLVTLTFARAVARRRPAAGLIVHSDQGSQY